MIRMIISDYEQMKLQPCTQTRKAFTEYSGVSLRGLYDATYHPQLMIGAVFTTLHTTRNS